MYKYINLNDTVYLHFPVNNTEGSGASGVTPAVKIRRSGDTANAAPTYSATPYLLSHVSFPQGCYEVAIPATLGNGFIIGNEYNAFATISISSQNPTGYIGGFTLNPINISQNIVKSGVIDALNTVVLPTAPSGSINEKMYNLATDTDIINGIDTSSTQLATLVTRLSSTRATYLDNLSSGVVATNSQVVTIDNIINDVKVVTDILNTMLENVGGQRFKAKALELTPVSSGIITTSNAVIESGIVVINNKVDSIATTANSIYQDTLLKIFV
jgi:hypothetical protein